MSFFETHIKDKNILLQSWIFLSLYIFIFYRLAQIKQSICYDQDVSMRLGEYLFSAIIPYALLWSLPLIILSTPIDYLLSKLNKAHSFKIIGAELLIGLLTFFYLVIKFTPLAEVEKTYACSFAGNEVLFDVFFSIAPLIIALLVFRGTKVFFYYLKFKWRA